jgi:tripartite-type tricarboxylate transporter receptor subunit TctC
MKLPRRNFLYLAAGAAALPAVSRFAWAQTYPTRPVTIIDAFAPGGNTDLAARIVGQHMSRTLGQQFVVENVAGAGGTIGSIRAMRAKPDGYTIQVGHTGTHAFSVSFTPTSPLSRMSISSQLAWSPSSLSLSWQGRTSHQKI